MNNFQSANNRINQLVGVNKPLNKNTMKEPRVIGKFDFNTGIVTYTGRNKYYLYRLYKNTRRILHNFINKF